MRMKSVFLLAAASLCILGALFLTVAGFDSARGFSRTWRNYYTVLVSDAIPPSVVQQRLDAARIAAISSDTNRIEYNDFSGMVSLPLSKISTRLDGLDPRYDPYMKELPRYFHQGRWNIYYLSLELPPPFSYLQIAYVLRGMDWRAADFNWRAAVLCLIVLTLTVVSVLRRAHRPRIATLALVAGSLPWIVAALNGNFVGTMAAALVYFGWAAILELALPLLRYRLAYGVSDRGRLKPIGGIASALVLAVGVLVSMQPGTRFWVLESAGALLCISAGVAILELWKHLRRQHRLFFPIRIQDGVRRQRQVGRRVLAVAWPLLILAVFPVLIYKEWHGDVEIPAPVVYPGLAGNSWTNMQRIWGVPSELPSLADYIAHRAYQRGVPYGMPYVLPQPGQRVVEQVFRHDGIRIASMPVVVQKYDEAWYRDALAHGNGIVKLLEQQPGVVVPQKRWIYRTGYPLTYLPVFWFLTFAVCVPAGLLRRKNGVETVAGLGISVSTLPAEKGERRRSLPEAPWRTAKPAAIGEEQRILVSHGVVGPD